METLEIELSYIHQLIDEEVARVLYQHFDWHMLEDCSDLFGLDISNIKRPVDILPSLIMQKSDEHLSAEKAERFKAVWQELTPVRQLQIAVKAWEPA